MSYRISKWLYCCGRNLPLLPLVFFPSTVFLSEIRKSPPQQSSIVRQGESIVIKSISNTSQNPNTKDKSSPPPQNPYGQPIIDDFRLFFQYMMKCRLLSAYRDSWTGKFLTFLATLGISGQISSEIGKKWGDKFDDKTI